MFLIQKWPCFLTFFPQFIDSSYDYGMLSFLILGLTFATTGLIRCSYLALLASLLSKSLRKNPSFRTVLSKISGIVFIELGIKLMSEKA